MMTYLLNTEWGKKNPYHAMFAGFLSDMAIALILLKLLGRL